jgi:hypothetical protein
MLLDDAADAIEALVGEVEKFKQARRVAFVRRTEQAEADRDEAADIIQELRDIQNGCPLPTWQEQFDAINKRADDFLDRIEGRGQTVVVEGRQD